MADEPKVCPLLACRFAWERDRETKCDCLRERCAVWVEDGHIEHPDGQLMPGKWRACGGHCGLIHHPGE